MDIHFFLGKGRFFRGGLINFFGFFTGWRGVFQGVGVFQVFRVIKSTMLLSYQQITIRPGKIAIRDDNQKVIVSR